MKSLRVFVLIALFFLFFSVESADAKEPMWSQSLGADGSKVAISEDGEYIVRGDYYDVSNEDGKLHLFSNNGTTLWRYWDMKGSVYSVDISADGEYIVVGSARGTLALFNKNSSEPLWKVAHDDWYSDVNVAISADGEYIAVGYDGLGTNFELYSRHSSEPLWWQYVGSDSHNSIRVAISDDGEYIATGSNSKLSLFNKNNSEPLWESSGHVRSVDISADGDYIIGGYHNNFRLFDKNSNISIWNHSVEDAYSVSISADGKYIAGSTKCDDCNTDSSFYFFDIENDTVMSQSFEQEDWPQISISADGDYLAVGNSSEVWLTTKTQHMLTVSTEHGGCDGDERKCDVQHVDISANGEYMVVSTKRSIYLWNTMNHLPEITGINPISVYEGQASNFNIDVFDEDGDELEISWVMGDGTVFENVGKEVFHSFSDNGSYDVTISVYDGKETTTAIYEITVNNMAPILSISYDDIGQEGQVLSFTAQIEDIPEDTVTVTWSFPDGTQVEGNFAQYLFVDDGEFMIMVIANDEDGGETYEQIMVTIQNVAPIFSEFIMPAQAKQFFEVKFSVLAEDMGDDIITYNFDFAGSKATSLNGTIYYTFKQGGNQNIVVCAIDEDGGETCQTEVISVTNFDFPIAIAGSDLNVKPGDIVQFNGAGTSDIDSMIVLYEWDFNGDGVYELSSEENGRTTNIYNTEGEYNPTLRVTDGIGNTDLDSFKIVVEKDSEPEVNQDEETAIPSISLISVVISIGLLAIFRRKN